MQIWPAIDLRGGKCVRLQQGDYDIESGSEWVTADRDYHRFPGLRIRHPLE
jgi:phosphoribosylformimino-5-aminoimidazole carboxamide ribonucleotide (ProFAR) isomerase